MKTLKYCAVSLVLAISSISVNAQSVPFLNYPKNAESLSMGGVTVIGDAASVLDDKVADADVSYFRWSPKGVGSNILNVDLSCSFKNFAVLADFGRAGNGTYPIYDGNGTQQGEYKAADLMVGLGAAYAITPDLSVSLMAKYIGSDLAPEVKGAAFGVDINAVYRLRTLKFGLLASNIGSKIDYSITSVQLPMLIKVGASNDFVFGEKLQLGVGIDAGYLTQSEHGSFVASAGADLRMFDILSVRAGYHFSSNNEMEPSYVSTGLGVNVSVVSLSAAFLFGSPAMNGTLCATLGVRF